MKSSDLLQCLRIAHKASLSVFIKGPPGGGKTTIAREYGKKHKMDVVHCHAPLMDLIDIKGCISIEDAVAKFLPLSKWPKHEDGPAVIIIDELPQCVTAIQNGFSQLLIEQIMGDIRLPKGSFVIATGNRKQDKAAANNVPAQLVNRVLHIELEEDRDGWFNWASKVGLHPHVLAFIKFKPDALFTFDPSDSQSPYGTPRSWEYVSNLLKAMPDDKFLVELVGGLVGLGNASVFAAYRRQCLTLPDPKEMLRNPSTCAIPTDPGVMYALCTSLSYYVDETSVDNFMLIADRLPEEFSMTMVKEAGDRCVPLRKHKGLKSWMHANAKYVADSDWDKS
jgi:hypothetical protein